MSRATERKTRPGRLRALDALVVAEEVPRWRGPARVVDLGFGAVAATTLELREALPGGTEVFGVDRDPECVAYARAKEAPGLRFLVGDFDLPAPARPATLLRAMNVLRGYPVDEVGPARGRMGSALSDGGLLLEGSCGPKGEVGTTLWFRRRGSRLVAERLWFWTDFSHGFAPLLFRDRLPRDLRAVPADSPLRALFADWTACVTTEVRDPRDRFVRTAERLVERRSDVPDRGLAFRDGALSWCPPAGFLEQGSGT